MPNAMIITQLVLQFIVAACFNSLYAIRKELLRPNRVEEHHLCRDMSVKRQTKPEKPHKPYNAPHFCTHLPPRYCSAGLCLCSLRLVPPESLALHQRCCTTACTEGLFIVVELPSVFGSIMNLALVDTRLPKWLMLESGILIFADHYARVVCK